VVFYGLWRRRHSNNTEHYLLAGQTLPWYAMALSIMATQASAVTFISTTGQSYVDGMRFVQFYFGLPFAKRPSFRSRRSRSSTVPGYSRLMSIWSNVSMRRPGWW
jgi:hypothetical protein